MNLRGTPLTLCGVLILISSLAGCRTPRNAQVSSADRAPAAICDVTTSAEPVRSTPVTETEVSDEDDSSRPSDPIGKVVLTSGSDDSSSDSSDKKNTSSTEPSKNPPPSDPKYPLAVEFAADGPTPVTFNQAMMAGLSSHPTIGVAIEAIQQSQGDFLQSSLLPNPTVLADVLMLPFGRPFTPLHQGGPPQQDVFVSYPIDWFLFGKRTAAMAATQYAVHVNQADYQDLIRTRIELVASTFYSVVEAQALEDLARANVANLLEVQETTQRAVDVGKRPTVELNRIKLDVVSAQQELRRAQATVITTAASLRSVAGWTDIPMQVKVDWDLATPLQPNPLSVEESLVTAERERPDLESLRWQMTKTGADVVVAQRAGKPIVTPALGWTNQYQKEIDQQNASSWNASVTMSVPIFDRNQGNVAKAEAARRQVCWQYQAKLLEVKAEVQQAVAELRAAEDNARAVADDQLDLAIKVRDSIIEAYGIGGRPLIDVLDAQRNYRETYRLYITSRTVYWKALYRYRAAVGKQAFEHE